MYGLFTYVWDHLGSFGGKCREIYHTLSIWVQDRNLKEERTLEWWYFKSLLSDLFCDMTVEGEEVDYDLT